MLKKILVTGLMLGGFASQVHAHILPTSGIQCSVSADTAEPTVLVENYENGIGLMQRGQLNGYQFEVITQQLDGMDDSAHPTVRIGIRNSRNKLVFGSDGGMVAHTSIKTNPELSTSIYFDDGKNTYDIHCSLPSNVSN